MGTLDSTNSDTEANMTKTNDIYEAGKAPEGAAHIEHWTYYGTLGAGTKSGAAGMKRHQWTLVAANGRRLETFNRKADAIRAFGYLPAEFK